MKKTIEVVGAILENIDGDIFCAMRPKDKSFPGMWEFPGGKIEIGERPEVSLEREIKEELNIKIRVDKIFGEVQKEYEEFIIKLYCYNCTILDFSEFKLIEHQEFKWVKKIELNQLNWVPTDIPIVEKLVALDRK